MRWLADLRRLEARGELAVCVTVALTRGHAPREAGAKMLVTRGETFGTVGGGNLEMAATARARELLALGARAPELLPFRLTEGAPSRHARQCCGGEVTLLLEPLHFARPAVAIFGLGHVGLALARALAPLELDLHLIDTRAEHADPARLQLGGAARLRPRHAPIPEVALHDLPPGSHLVIMTHDHAEDLALLDAALRRNDLGFVGLIGSKVKWINFKARLAREGHDEAALARVTTPIGVPGVAGKSPEVIAIAVAAQLVGVIEAAEQRAGGIPTPARKLEPSLR